MASAGNLTRTSASAFRVERQTQPFSASHLALQHLGNGWRSLGVARDEDGQQVVRRKLAGQLRVRRRHQLLLAVMRAHGDPHRPTTDGSAQLMVLVVCFCFRCVDGIRCFVSKPNKQALKLFKGNAHGSRQGTHQT
jgi:hypothetical protein